MAFNHSQCVFGLAVWTWKGMTDVVEVSMGGGFTLYLTGAGPPIEGTDKSMFAWLV